MCRRLPMARERCSRRCPLGTFPADQIIDSVVGDVAGRASVVVGTIDAHRVDRAVLQFEFNDPVLGEGHLIHEHVGDVSSRPLDVPVQWHGSQLSRLAFFHEQPTNRRNRLQLKHTRSERPGVRAEQVVAGGNGQQ